MGHEIRYLEFSKDATKDEMFKRRAGIIRASGDRDPADGYLLAHDNGLTLHKDKVYPSYDDALDAIKRFDRGFYDDHGVLYKEPASPSKARVELKNRIQDTKRKKREYYDSHLPNKAKAAFVGCPECKSKLAKEHLSSNRCPVCRANMFPKTTRDRLRAFDEKIRQLEEKELDLERKQKGEVKWLVKLEFNT